MSTALLELLFQSFQEGIQIENAIHATQQQQALETTVQIINQQVAVLQNDFALLAQSQGAQLLNVLDELNSIRTTLSQLQAQTGIPQQTGRPVTLPATPPAGYGGASSSSVADAVWGYALPNATPFTALEAQDSSMGWMFMLSNNNATVPFRANPGYAIGGLFGEPRASFSGPTFASLDFSTILSTDATIYAWAHRVYPAAPWVNDVDGQAFERDSNNGAILWYVDLTPEQFRQLKGTSGSTVRVPPVWPGVANVTLQATHALANGLVVTGPMDGAIVALTSVPNTKTSYVFGAAEHDWFRIGAIAFADDRGEYEPPQLLGLDNAIYCPRYMQHAASFAVRLQGTITGTARGWTAN